jgi:cyclopropane-fatty-acyl-phospholipid synthase
VWRTYLVSCAEMFRAARGRTHLFQIVYSKGNITKDNYPMSRAFLYEDEWAQQHTQPSARHPAQV